MTDRRDSIVMPTCQRCGGMEPAWMDCHRKGCPPFAALRDEEWVRRGSLAHDDKARGRLMGLIARDDDPERTKRDQARREFNEGWGETVAKVNRARERGEWPFTLSRPGWDAQHPPASDDSELRSNDA